MSQSLWVAEDRKSLVELPSGGQSLDTSHAKARCIGCGEGELARGTVGTGGWARLQGLGASQEGRLREGRQGRESGVSRS